MPHRDGHHDRHCAGGRLRGRHALAVLVAIWSQAALRAADPMPGDNVLLRCEFAVGKGGRMLVLPVKVGQSVVPCLLDTGARYSGFDSSLREMLGETVGQRVLTTPAGKSRAYAYSWPEASLGGQPLKSDQPVVCIALDDVRHATDEGILGVIGMDVLRHCRLQIDFDRGVLAFLDSLPENRDELGEQVSFCSIDDGIPVILGLLAEGLSRPFIIDTGAHGNSLTAKSFDGLVKANQIRLGSTSVSATVGGEVRTERGRLRRFTVGPFSHEELRFSRLNMSSLGLRYLSRYRVTFDFPGSCVYLRRGGQFDKPEPSATSGLVLSWRDGQAVVDAVRPDGPGRRAGLKPGDVLLRIDDRGACDFDPYALRQLLTSQQGRNVPMTVRRDERELEVELLLDEG
jgi:hypothetical protein